MRFANSAAGGVERQQHDGNRHRRGAPSHIAKGDFILVPENTAHGFTETDGALVIMSFHVPAGGVAR